MKMENQKRELANKDKNVANKWTDNAKFKLNINGDLEETADHGNTDIATFQETLDMHLEELSER